MKLIGFLFERFLLQQAETSNNYTIEYIAETKRLNSPNDDGQFAAETKRPVLPYIKTISNGNELGE